MVSNTLAKDVQENKEPVLKLSTDHHQPGTSAIFMTFVMGFLIGLLVVDDVPGNLTPPLCSNGLFTLPKLALTVGV